MGLWDWLLGDTGLQPQPGGSGGVSDVDRRIASVEASARSIEGRVSALELRTTDHGRRLDAHVAWLAQIETRLGQIDPLPPPPTNPPPTNPPTNPPTGPERIPGGVPSWAGEVLWRRDAPFRSLSGRVLAASAAWLDAVHDTSASGTGRIEIAWMRLHAIVGGADRVIAADDYTTRTVCGGLFSRNPWFGSDEREPLAVEWTAQGVVLPVSNRRDRVWHLWNCRRVIAPAGTTRVWSEARVRVTGAAAVEVGVDHFESTSSSVVARQNHAEGSRGRWFFAAADWFTIASGKPGEIDRVTTPVST